MSGTRALIDPTHAARCLQDLAIVGLSDWFASPATGQRRPSGEGLQDLLNMLAEPEDMGNVQRRTAARFKAGFLVADALDLTFCQQRWVSDKVPARPLRDLSARVRDRIDRLAGKAALEGPPMAVLMEDVSVELAWRPPAFRRQVASLLRDHLRQRVILHPESPVIPSLATPTLWAAVAAGAQAIELPLKDDAATRLRDRLSQKVSSLLVTKHWAGFWDGYALTLEEAVKTIGQLDFKMNLSDGIAASAKYRLNWREEIPGYAAQLLNNRL